MGPVSWKERPQGPKSRMVSPLPRGEPATQGERAGALASRAPRPRAATRAAEDESEASRGAPSSQQGRGRRRLIHPGCPPPSSGSNTESRAARGQRTQGSHEEESLAGRDTSSKRSRKTWRSPELVSRTSPGQSNERRGRPAAPNTKRISRVGHSFFSKERFVLCVLFRSL